MRTDLTDAQADLLSGAMILEGFSSISFYLMMFIALCLFCQYFWGRE